MKIDAKVSIPTPRKIVWGVLMRTDSWKIWYGRELRKVDPEWGIGAQMVWADGEPDTITGYMPNEKLVFGACDFMLHPMTDRITMAIYRETIDPNLSQEGLWAKQQQIQSIALGLKKYVENHGARPLLYRLLGAVFGKSR